MRRGPPVVRIRREQMHFFNWPPRAMLFNMGKNSNDKNAKREGKKAGYLCIRTTHSPINPASK